MIFPQSGNSKVIIIDINIIIIINELQLICKGFVNDLLAINEDNTALSQACCTEIQLWTLGSISSTFLWVPSIEQCFAFILTAPVTHASVFLVYTSCPYLLCKVKGSKEKKISCKNPTKEN